MTDIKIMNENAPNKGAISVQIWDEEWELTWPIWHMLSRNERKDLALRYGYKTIGEFEEYMTLQRAVGDSFTNKPYSNNLAYPQKEHEDSLDHVKVNHKTKTTEKIEEEDSDHEELDEQIESERLAAQDQLPTNELLEIGGQILMLSDDLLHRIFDYLPVDAYATLALVSPHWKSFTRTEAAYRRLCERLYLQQSKRRMLHVSRFGNSYRVMLEKRPRVRAGGGVYIIKYKQIKKIQRDMWTEVSDTQYTHAMQVQFDATKVSHQHTPIYVRSLMVLFWRAYIIDICIFKKTGVSFMH